MQKNIMVFKFSKEDLNTTEESTYILKEQGSFGVRYAMVLSSMWPRACTAYKAESYFNSIIAR
jgi:hypothetical protein